MLTSKMFARLLYWVNKFMTRFVRRGDGGVRYRIGGVGVGRGGVGGRRGCWNTRVIQIAFPFTLRSPPRSRRSSILQTTPLVRWSTSSFFSHFRGEKWCTLRSTFLREHWILWNRRMGPKTLKSQFTMRIHIHIRHRRCFWCVTGC